MSAICPTLRSWWSLDEASDPRVDAHVASDDLITNTAVGVLGGGTVGSTTGLQDDAAEFLLDSGVPATPFIPGLISSAWGTAYNPDASFYIAGWFEITAVGDEFAVLAQYTSEDYQDLWGLDYDPNAGPNQGLRFWLQTEDGEEEQIVAGVLTEDIWYHFLLEYDADANTFALRINNGTASVLTLTAPPDLTDPFQDDNINQGKLRVSGQAGGLGFTATEWNADEYLFGKGGLTDSDDRTWLYNAGAGRAYAELADYCGLTVDLTETLALIIADPSSLLRDPALPPSGGTGQPVRFREYIGAGFTDACDPVNTAATVCTKTQRTIPSGLATHLAGTALTLTYCLKLTRRDTQVLGFTTHDHDLTFGGVTYEALNSVSLTTLRQELGASVGSMDVSGLIRSDKVTAEDLLAGRYDGAELAILLVNWASLGDGAVTLARGWFGAVTLVDGAWKVEYRSIAQRMQQQVVELTSPTCRVRALGDARCAPGGTFANGAVLTDYQFSRTVASVTDTRQMVFSSDSHATGYYNAGRVLFTSGDNDGLEREIKSHTLSGGTAEIVLQEGVPFAVSPGDTATLEAGCDRRLLICKSRFHNVKNMRAEPHVPGFDVFRRTQNLGIPS